MTLFLEDDFQKMDNPLVVSLELVILRTPGRMTMPLLNWCTSVIVGPILQRMSIDLIGRRDFALTREGNKGAQLAGGGLSHYIWSNVHMIHGRD